MENKRRILVTGEKGFFGKRSNKEFKAIGPWS
jgi:hypothetical protein